MMKILRLIIIILPCNREQIILKIVQRVLNDKKNFSRAWQLNERHYGALTGLNKIEMSKKLVKKRY